MKFISLCMAAAALTAPAVAKGPSVHVSGWARAGVGSSAAYARVHNGGPADRLIGASSPVARQVSIHDSQNHGGVMRMRGAGRVPVAAGGTIAMKPGGLHIMLTGLRTPLRPGTTLPVILQFERAGRVLANLPVLPAGAQGPSAGGHGGH